MLTLLLPCRTVWPWASPWTLAVWRLLCRKMWQRPPGRKLRLSNYTPPYKYKALVKRVWEPHGSEGGAKTLPLEIDGYCFIQKHQYSGIYTMERIHTVAQSGHELRKPPCSTPANLHHGPLILAFFRPQENTHWGHINELPQAFTPCPQNYPDQLPSLCLLLLCFFHFRTDICLLALASRGSLWPLLF